MEAFTQLLKVKTDTIAAPEMVVAVQNLPSPAYFTGEVNDAVDDSFNR